MSFRTPERATKNKRLCRKVLGVGNRNCYSPALALWTVVRRAAPLDHAFDLRSTFHTRLAGAFVNAPEAFRGFKVTAVSIGEIDAESRTCVDCFLQCVANRVVQLARAWL